ncbi:hypothetical protein HY414_02500 [Candidatus Kaiserbacteria bacterium]|nr:hypothetical protein [Candidatus Kaiserbacteria bacterium]
MRLHIEQLLGWGIVIYAVMYLLSTVLATYGFFEGVMPRVVSLAVLVGTAVIAGSSLRVHTWRDILPYSISWGMIVAVIDGVMLFPFAGWQIYANWSVWFGYALVALAPLLALYPRFNRFTPTSSV